MSEQQEDIRVILERLDGRGERMEDDLKKLKHVLLEGNGTPAMTVQVATMDQRIKAIEDIGKDKKIPRQVALGIFVSIVLGLTSILMGMN